MFPSCNEKSGVGGIGDRVSNPNEYNAEEKWVQ